MYNTGHLELNAPAKLNLSLDITGKRPDGYHTVDMIMQSVMLSDTLIFDFTPDTPKPIQDRISLTIESCPLRETDPDGPQPGSFQSGPSNAPDDQPPQVPAGSDNLIIKAIKLLEDTISPDPGYRLDIRLIKRIPMAAGLAGGSTDAAAALIAMNRLLGLDLSEGDLMDLGVRLGADIPYCITAILAREHGDPTTYRARGIGEELTPLPSPDRCHVLLAKPGISISTAWSYTTYDQCAANIPHPDMDICCDVLRMGDPDILSHFGGNVLESVALSHYPEIGTIESIMNGCGASLSRMSGSGPTVFGLFKNEADAREAESRLAASSLLEDSAAGACALILTSTI